MDINPNIFRAYDIRGVVGKDLSEEIYYHLGRGYGTFLSQRRINLCPVGFDNRLESLKYSNALIRGLNDSGIETIELGLSLSPIVYFSSYFFSTRGCAMITASHNPKEYNGLKLGIGYSETLSGEDIQTLRSIVESEKYTTGKAKNQRFNIFPDYLDQLLKHFTSKKRWKIVVDGCNSGSGVFFPEIFSKLGCKVIEQNCRPDGHFPLSTPDPTDSKVLKRLSDRVIKEKADLGFSFDADGDRVGIVDETGSRHWMDIIYSIFAQDVLEYVPSSRIVYNNLCSKTVPHVINKFGGIAVMCKTGHSFVREKMREVGAILGGELSGHIFFNDGYFGHDDAAYACLRLLSFLERKNQTLSQAVSFVDVYFSSPEIKIGVSDDIKMGFVSGPLRQELLALYPEAEISDLDGIRVDTDTLMVVIRASQNGPYITIRFEAIDESTYYNVKQSLSAILRKYPEIDWNTGVNTDALS